MVNNNNNQTIPVFTQHYLKIIALVTFLLGIYLVLAPSLISSLFFEVQYPASTFFVRMLGSTLIGYGTLNFLATRSGSLEAYKLAVSVNLITLLVASCITVFYFELFTGYAWLAVGQHVLFAAGFVICSWQLAGKQNLPKTTPLIEDIPIIQ